MAAASASNNLVLLGYVPTWKIIASEESVDDIGIVKLTNEQISQPADSKTFYRACSWLLSDA